MCTGGLFVFPNKRYFMTRLKAFSSKSVLGVVESFTVQVLHPSLVLFAKQEMQAPLLSSAPPLQLYSKQRM